jgi:hypothetical protein
MLNVVMLSVVAPKKCNLKSMSYNIFVIILIRIIFLFLYHYRNFVYNNKMAQVSKGLFKILLNLQIYFD